MNKILLFGVTVFLVLLGYHYWKNPLSAKVKIHDQVFLVDVAVTPHQREQGLSGRKSLGPNSGMLFLFDQPGGYHFWMRGMNFPLDFIWIKGDTIIQLDQNIPVPKGGEPPVELAPVQPINKVLEVNAGVIKSLNISIGDRVEFLNK